VKEREREFVMNILVLRVNPFRIGGNVDEQEAASDV
jgi:hypothetical protein